MLTMTWTSKEDALRTAFLVPFRPLALNPVIDDGGSTNLGGLANA